MVKGEDKGWINPLSSSNPLHEFQMLESGMEWTEAICWCAQYLKGIQIHHENIDQRTKNVVHLFPKIMNKLYFVCVLYTTGATSFVTE